LLQHFQPKPYDARCQSKFSDDPAAIAKMIRLKRETRCANHFHPGMYCEAGTFLSGFYKGCGKNAKGYF
jgi:hypothetical protein